ncbi:MAG: thermonuclease family protein [Deltaproteobacteria bacterium]|jgi:endonuclease YncB( thermonuclease family)|nr:thermonuclease family protein [Deltaproteobacteria bacterium]
MRIRSERCTKLVRRAITGRNTEEKVSVRAPKTLLFLLIFVFGLSGIYLYGQGKVIKVYDGVSFAVFSRESDFARVRLYGINCPSLTEPWGREAKIFTDSLLFLQKPALTPINKNKQGQVVALVQSAEGRLLNEELLRNGYAWVDQASCTEIWCESWLDIEQHAKNLKLRIWNKAQAE